MTEYQQYQVCIEACLKCASVCTYCASACTKEPDIDGMRECIQLNLECATMCMSFAKMMSLGSDHIKELARICAMICDACAEECSKHHHDHCRETAEVCTKCADECELVAR